MKSRTIFFILSIVSWTVVPCLSQDILSIDPSINIQNSPSEIKAINMDGKEIGIPCRNYLLPKTIEITDVLHDSAHRELIIFAKKGIRESASNPVYLLAYNYQKDELIWGRQSKYYKGMSGFLTSDLVIFRIFNGRYWKNFAFKQKDGQLAWQNIFELKYPIVSKDIAFHGSLSCIDLSSGTIKWERKIDDDFGWLGKNIIGSDMICIIDGVHLFNLDTGNGWDIPFRTEKRNAQGYDLLTGLASKILLKDDRFFFSALDIMICADYQTGKKFWQIRLPEPMTGSAFLDFQGDNLVFINRGGGLINNVIQSYFVPYILILNKTNGNTLFSTNVKTSFDPVIDYFIADSSIYLSTVNDIFIYGHKCNLIKKLSSSPDSMVRTKTGYFYCFIDEQTQKNTYVNFGPNTKEFNSLSILHENGFEYFLYTEKGIVCFDREMHETNWIPEANVFQCLERFNGKCILSPIRKYSTKRIIIEDQKNGEALFNLNFLYRSTIENGFLMLFQTSNSVSVIPLSDFDKQ
jgi:outer membrane protein assembly factor BamB